MQRKRWTTHWLFLIGLFLLLLSPIPGSATVVFSDDFNSENGGGSALNYSSFANWTVTSGTVDLIGNGFYDFFPANVLYVDLDGSTMQAGRMETKTSFGPGSYVLSFDLAGSQRGNPNTVNVYFGGLVDSITLEYTVPFTTYTYNVTLAAPGSIVFDHLGGDYEGLLLDNVVVQVVPLPPTLLLLGSGLLGLVSWRRFRKN
jgi:hypothetical protein